MNLKRAAADDSTSSLQRLIVQCRPLLHLAARQRMRDRFRGRFDESDIVQLTCIKAMQSFDTYQGSSAGEWLAWLETILRRSLAELHEHHTMQKRDIHRESSRRLPSGEMFPSGELSIQWNGLADHGSGPVSKVIRGEHAVLLAGALRQLPREYRRVIELRFLDGKKIREIAEQIGSSVLRVAGLLRRGLESLHDSLPAELRQAIEGENC